MVLELLVRNNLILCRGVDGYGSLVIPQPRRDNVIIPSLSQLQINDASCAFHTASLSLVSPVVFSGQKNYMADEAA
jgi:hypothetical protein